VYPFARSTSFFHNQLQGNVTPHVVSNLFLSSDQYPDPNAKIEITKVVEKKRKAMLAHKSQFSKKLVDQIITEDNKTGKKYFEYGRFVNLLF